MLGNHLRAAQLETVRPKAMRPADFVQTDGLDFGERAGGRVHHAGFCRRQKSRSKMKEQTSNIND